MVVYGELCNADVGFIRGIDEAGTFLSRGLGVAK